MDIRGLLLGAWRQARAWLQSRRWFQREPEVWEEESYQKAYEYKNEFETKEGADYKWVATYAEFNFRQLLSSNQALDGKAEGLITVFAGGSGLISIGALPKLTTVSIWVSILWGLALVLAVTCVILAYKIRFPKETFMPPSIGWALEYVRSFDSQAEAKFLAQWHLACEGIRLSNTRKARMLKTAMNFGIAAVVILGMSFGAAFVTMGQVSSKPSAKGSSMAEPDPTPAPNPATQPQTPPTASSETAIELSGPQTMQAGHRNTAIQASPQSIEESRDSERYRTP